MAKGAAKRAGEQKAPQPWTGPTVYEEQLWESLKYRNPLCHCGCGERAERVTKVEGNPVLAGWVCFDYEKRSDR